MKKITFLTTPPACGRHPFKFFPKTLRFLTAFGMTKGNVLAFCLLLFCFLPSTFAQITIGKNQAPQSYSVLELVAQYKSGEYGGFRLPQLTTAQRDALGVTASDIVEHRSAVLILLQILMPTILLR